MYIHSQMVNLDRQSGDKVKNLGSYPKEVGGGTPVEEKFWGYFFKLDSSILNIDINGKH